MSIITRFSVPAPGKEVDEQTRVFLGLIAGMLAYVKTLPQEKDNNLVINDALDELILKLRLLGVKGMGTTPGAFSDHEEETIYALLMGVEWAFRILKKVYTNAELHEAGFTLMKEMHESVEK